MGDENDGRGVREFVRAATVIDPTWRKPDEIRLHACRRRYRRGRSCIGAGKVLQRAPKANWQPKSALESQLQADGYKVRQIKTEGGCYEVYATDKGGNRANMAFNAETLEKLDNAEAGEN
jgi:hypothetical protein